MDKFLQQAREFVQGLNQQQKLLLGGGAAVILALIGVFVLVLNKPEMKTLYAGLAQEEAQEVAKRLAERNVSYELTPDGSTLKVPGDQLDKVRLDLAAQGLPRSGRLGFEIFDKPNWAGSDFAEKVNYQRALEGELERTIQTIETVEAVRVHLVMPRESLYTEREREAKASVVLKLHGSKLDDVAAKAIPFLVASAVDTLRPENVTVVSAEGRPLTSFHKNGVTPDQMELEKALADKLSATLAPVVGLERLRSSVNVEFDSSSTESTQETYDPKQSVVLTTQQTEDRQGAGLAAGGVPGTATNVPQAGTPPAQIAKTVTEEGQFQKTQSETYAVSRSVRHNVQPAGSVRRIATGILVDDGTETILKNGKYTEQRRKRTPEELQQLEALAKAAVGFDTARGDVLTIQNISFQVTPVETLPTPNWKDKLPNAVQTLRDPLRYVLILLAFAAIYFLVLRPIQKQFHVVVQAPQGMRATMSEPAVALASAGGPAATSAPSLAAASAATRQEEEAILETELQKELNSTGSDVKRAVILKRHLVEQVKGEPLVASRLIQNWLHARGDRR